jgi:hypothetical protein
MQTAGDKVRDLKTESRKTPNQEADEIKAKTNSDLGKVALFISLLTVILLIVFFFGMNQNMTGLTDEVRDIPQIKERISEMSGRMDNMETEMAALRDLPQEARRMVVRSMLQEMAQRVNYMSVEVENEQQSVKLNEARELLQEVQADLAK